MTSPKPSDWLSRPLDIPEEALREMTQAGVDALPRETGGVLFPEPLGGSWVQVLTNLSPTPNEAIHFDNEEVVQSMLRWVSSNDDWVKMTLWHTHPAGNIGPSRRDMRSRLKDMGNLVVAIQPGGIGIPTWF